MSHFFKAVLVVLIVAYVVSPIDLVPGPIDDALLILFALGGNRLTKKGN